MIRGSLAFAAGLALVSASVAAGGPMEPEILVAKDVTDDRVHWSATARPSTSRSASVDIRERGPAGSTLYTGQGTRPDCNQLGIATHGASVIGPVDDDPSDQKWLLTVSGVIKPKVRSVLVRVADRKKVHKTRAQLGFVSPAEAETLGVKRFGWWFASVKTNRRPRGKTTAIARDSGGERLKPAAIYEDGGFGCAGQAARAAAD
jgi:hypothetical protein